MKEKEKGNVAEWKAALQLCFCDLTSILGGVIVLMHIFFAVMLCVCLTCLICFQALKSLGHLKKTSGGFFVFVFCLMECFLYVSAMLIG